MTLAGVIEATGWFCVLYVAFMNIGYFSLNIASYVALGRHARRHVLQAMPQAWSDFEPPISLLVPAYNEEATVVATVRSLLQLDYAHYEIVVVNDGSRDATLRTLSEAFKLERVPEALRIEIPTQAVRDLYQSAAHPELRVVDKENGGKADALNAGINAARYPLFCALDADGILQRDSLRRVANPFIQDADTVAAGGIVRVANGCRVVGGWLVEKGLPRNPLALFQTVEYCRAFLFGRLGWDPINAVLVISGAFGVFRKATVISIGGYRVDTIGEDMDLVMRIHRDLRRRGEQYRIAFIPDPVCWTEVPEDLRVLSNQRVRWQRGLCESLWANRALLFGRRGGVVGWVAFPFVLFVEGLSPIFEVIGYLLLVYGISTGSLDVAFATAFLTVAIGLGMLLSVSALLLDEMSYGSYPSLRHIGFLLLGAIGENFGYRQLNSYWRLKGIVLWIFGTKHVWGEMRRTATWSSAMGSKGVEEQP